MQIYLCRGVCRIFHRGGGGGLWTAYRPVCVRACEVVWTVASRARAGPGAAQLIGPPTGLPLPPPTKNCPSVARPTFFLGGPPPPYQNPGSPTDKILDPPRCFCFPPGPPRHPGPGALAPPAPPPSHRAWVWSIFVWS